MYMLRILCGLLCTLVATSSRAIDNTRSNPTQGHRINFDKDSRLRIERDIWPYGVMAAKSVQTASVVHESSRQQEVSQHIINEIGPEELSPETKDRLCRAWSVEKEQLPKWARDDTCLSPYLLSHSSNPHYEFPIDLSDDTLIECDARGRNKPTLRSPHIIDKTFEWLFGEEKMLFYLEQNQEAPPLRPVEHVIKGIIYHDENRIKKYLSAQHVNSYFTRNQITLLHLGALSGFTQGCRMLLHQGAHPIQHGYASLVHNNNPSLSGYMTPLHIAAYFGYHDIKQMIRHHDTASMQTPAYVTYGNAGPQNMTPAHVEY